MRLAFLSAALAALAAVLAVLLPAGIASAAPGPAAGTRVWAISSAGQDHVGDDRGVSAGERLGAAAVCPFCVSGACVAAEDGVGLFRQSVPIEGTSGSPVEPTLENVQRAASRAGVGLRGVKVSIDNDPDLLGRQLYGHTLDSGNITLYPDAFANEETLATTLGH